MPPNGWIGVDLDGTIAYHGGGAAHEVGHPIDGMVSRVKQWLAEGRDVRIVTARVSRSNHDFFVRAQELLIQLWCEKHLGARLPITSEKDFAMLELWDDRAVQVIRNTGLAVTVA